MPVRDYQRAQWDNELNRIATAPGLATFVRNAYASGILTGTTLDGYLEDPTWETMNGLCDRLPTDQPLRAVLPNEPGKVGKSTHEALTLMDAYLAAIRTGRALHGRIDSVLNVAATLDAIVEVEAMRLQSDNEPKSTGEQDVSTRDGLAEFAGRTIEHCQEFVAFLQGNDPLGFACRWLAQKDKRFDEIQSVAHGQFPTRVITGTIGDETFTADVDLN